MRTILQIHPHDINEQLLQIIKSLMLPNNEILIQPMVKNPSKKLLPWEEFFNSPLKVTDDFMQERIDLPH
jgi:hypothetical protein